jgi:hypothetical protein
MCSTNQDCFYIDNTTKLVTGNKCDDPNGNCICLNGTCTSNSCSADSECAKFGSNCVCYNGTCSCQPCSTSSECPYNMECNGTVCTSIKCQKRSDCPNWSVCSGYGNAKYCARPYIVPTFTLIMLIILSIIISVIGYYVYSQYKK